MFAVYLLMPRSLVVLQAETHVTIKPAIAREILGCMVTLPWEVNLSLCPHILNHFPYLAPPQFFTSEDQRRLPER